MDSAASRTQPANFSAKLQRDYAQSLPNGRVCSSACATVIDVVASSAATIDANFMRFRY